MRKEFKMTAAQRETLLDAMKPQPLMYLSGGAPMFRSQQERANDAWAALGKELGFQSMTVRPVSGKGDLFFTAEEAEQAATPPAPQKE